VLYFTIFWDIMLCSPLKVNWRLGGTCRLHLQGQRINQARNQCEACSKHAYSLTVKMEATCSCEMLVDFQQTARRYIPEDSLVYCEWSSWQSSYRWCYLLTGVHRHLWKYHCAWWSETFVTTAAARNAPDIRPSAHTSGGDVWFSQQQLWGLLPPGMWQHVVWKMRKLLSSPLESENGRSRSCQKAGESLRVCIVSHQRRVSS
jgi:hypothetical protein